MNVTSGWKRRGETIVGLAGLFIVSGCATGARASLSTNRTASAVVHPFNSSGLQATLLPASGGLPENLTVPGRHRALIARMWAASPTFRRQCARIEQAKARLAVDVRYATTSPMSMRAWTDIEPRGRGRHFAIVFLQPDHERERVELIAHELEHILEWLDGVDYATIRRGAGVNRHPDGTVETMRAVAVGRQVAREVESAPRGVGRRTET